MSNEREEVQRETRDLLAASVRRQRHESHLPRGEAPPLPGIPSRPVGLPKSYWGDRQAEGVAEFLTLLPIIEIVAGLPERVDTKLSESETDALMDSRLTLLLRARRIVVERVRKEI